MKVAVLLSGGLDSTTALHWAHRHHEVVCALSFDYGSNHAKHELACARRQAEILSVPYHEVDLRSVSAHLQSALLNGADAIPTGDYAEDNLKQTVVPFRNGIFLAIAAGIAESCGAEGIVIAAHNGDHALYPDCREDFMSALASAISLGTYANLQILRPFIANTKAEITAIDAMYTEESAASFHLEEYDYVIDCIDSLRDKCDLILRTTALERPTLLCSMGAALRIDPTKVRMAEFRKVEGDALARAVRNRFKKAKTFPRRKFLCVYSEEPAMQNQLSEDTIQEELKFNKVQTNGSLCHITAIFGMMLAGEVIKRLTTDGTNT